MAEKGCWGARRAREQQQQQARWRLEGSSGTGRQVLCCQLDCENTSSWTVKTQSDGTVKTGAVGAQVGSLQDVDPQGPPCCCHCHLFSPCLGLSQPVAGWGGSSRQPQQQQQVQRRQQVQPTELMKATCV